jgi:hypothetical protein
MSKIRASVIAASASAALLIVSAANAVAVPFADTVAISAS